MNTDLPYQGSLFAEDFLTKSIVELDDWENVSESELDKFQSDLLDLFARFPTDGSPNETQTEADLIAPVLGLLGWDADLPQQNLSARGRKDVPDRLLFGDAKTKDHANSFDEEWKRYEFGLAVVESKRWLRPLDRRSGRPGEQTAPSAQIMRYLRRIDDVTSGKLRWGILTNGRQWRLYYQGALSVAEQFFELDLAVVLNIAVPKESEIKLEADDRRHWLRVFMLVLGRDAFLSDSVDTTFHQRAINESRFQQERVTASISKLVFGQVFPDLARAIAEAAEDATLEEVRDATLILLYRLLFILYAEDRNLLPVRDSRYENYSFREKVRAEVGERKDLVSTFSSQATQYWSVIDHLSRAIDTGDPSIGLPPYNGGLFDRKRTPLLSEVQLNDAVIADVIDALAFEQTPNGRSYINYRDLGVQQLGSIYERLLEQEIIQEDGSIDVRPNIFARKDSGSYYTPDDLVGLIINEAVDPLVRSRMHDFQNEVADQDFEALPEDRQMGRLRRLDPAERILELKVCDPAMGSGHFLVNLVDHLSDRVLEAMAEAEASWDNYISPLNERIDTIRNSIISNAEEEGWAVDTSQLDDRHIVRRMVLKRCVYGVDKNPMAVELTKVSLWLHTFTVGAPLSFLDHHLRCGDTLFGSWVRPAMNRAETDGGVFLREPLSRATRAAAAMQIIEGLTDAEIAEAHRSAEVFADVVERTFPLNTFLSLLLAFDWMNLDDSDDKEAFTDWLSGLFGDPVALVMGEIDDTLQSDPVAKRFLNLLEEARQVMDKHRFLNWQVAFPGVWSEWEGSELQGGFDAVIGNPPWDRIALQKVEWFASRNRKIALTQRAADRSRLITDLQREDDPLAREYLDASTEAANVSRMARKSDDFPLLSKGDINLYSLFVERSMQLVKPDGLVGLLVPSGIASYKTASSFFKSVATQGRLSVLYDFENRRSRYDESRFFADVDGRFKFCAFVASPSSVNKDARCGFFLQAVSEVFDPERCFEINASQLSRINPNTGSLPIFRSRRDANLTTAIYDRLPVLVDRSNEKAQQIWPVRYTRMFDMANDSHLFRTRNELEEQDAAYPAEHNRYRSDDGLWLPLYEGKMVQMFDHRAADITVNETNLFRPGQQSNLEPASKSDPARLPNPRYWVLDDPNRHTWSDPWTIAFKSITASTNQRTMIAAVIPRAGAGHALPLLPIEDSHLDRATMACFVTANLNATIFDFVARQKVPGNNFSWYILEQLPIVPPEHYDEVIFGPKTASQIVREIVLELTYTAHDLGTFAESMSYVTESGKVKPPFLWDEDRRLHLRAKLDALYFHLYGVSDRDDIRYIFSTFPIIERMERKNFDSYRSLELCLAYFNALSAGNPEAIVDA